MEGVRPDREWDSLRRLLTHPPRREARGYRGLKYLGDIHEWKTSI